MLAAVFRVLGIFIFAIHIFFVISGEAAGKKHRPTIYDIQGKLSCKVTGPTKMPDVSPVDVSGQNPNGRKSIIDACGPAVAECRRHAKENGADPYQCRIIQMSYNSCVITVRHGAVETNVGCSGVGYDIQRNYTEMTAKGESAEGIVQAEYCRLKTSNCEVEIKRDRVKEDWGATVIEEPKAKKGYGNSWKPITKEAPPVR